jgi:hypothetical protein
VGEIVGPFTATEGAEPLDLSSTSLGIVTGFVFVPVSPLDSCCCCKRATFAARFWAAFEGFALLDLWCVNKQHVV